MAATVLFLWVHNIMGASGAVLKKKKKKNKIRKTTNLQSCVFVKCIQVEFSANFWQGSKIKTIVFIQVLLKFSAVE